MRLVDLPGTYSLMAHSPEEAVARDFLCSEQYDAAVVVCDATCLQRSLNLVLQVMELMGVLIKASNAEIEYPNPPPEAVPEQDGTCESE